MRNGKSKGQIVAKKDVFRVIACIVRAIYCLKTRLLRNKKKTIASIGPIRPNQNSRSLQKDGISHYWDRYSGTTNQDDPIGPRRSFGPIGSIRPRRSFLPIRSIGPTRSFGPIRSIGTTREFGPIRSIGPTRSFVPIRSLVPTRSLGPLSNGYILRSHL